MAFGLTNGLPVQRFRPPRASATIEVLPGKPEVIVHLRNDAGVVLQAWSVRIEYDLAASRKTKEVGVDTATNEVDTPDRGPILPGRIRDVHYYLEAQPTKAAVTVLMAMFEDGSVDGDSSWAHDMLTARERHGRSLEVWIAAFNVALGLPPAQARVLMEQTLATARAQAMEGPEAGYAHYQQVRSILNCPDDELLSRIADAKERFGRVRDRVLRHLSGKQ
jgi:hypothetical protein